MPQAFAVFVLTLLLYGLLSGELPYHDVDRFRAQVESGDYVWDIAHIFLQPATLLWHRYLGFGETAIDSQKHINAFATSIAIAVFYWTLAYLREPPWRRALGTILLAASCSVIILAPTGHKKLVAFPFVNGSLLLAVMWERKRAAGESAPPWLWLGSAALLAIAASFLVSALAAGPFAALAMIPIARRGGATWPAALRQGFWYGAVALVLFIALACAGFVLFAAQPLSVTGLRASVLAKADLKPEAYSLAADLARLLFATPQNFIAAPQLGPVGRALLAHQAPSIAPFLGVLIQQLIPWLLTLALLAAIYLRAVWAAARGVACLMPLAFLAGAQAWTIYYGLNDPEHWFQLSAPTILLFCLVFPVTARRLVLPVWTAMTLAVNLTLIALPVAQYPLNRYQAEAAAQLDPGDLVIHFAAFPGRPYAGFLDIPGVPRLKLDQLLRDTPDDAAYFAAIEQAIDATLAHGGRAIVFDILDPDDWDAPWPFLYAHGMTKTRLFGFLDGHYTVSRIGGIAGLKTWRLTAAPPAHRPPGN